MGRIFYSRAWAAPDHEKYLDIAQVMVGLMLNNVATSAHVLTGTSGRHSQPGCIIASPSFPSRPPSSADVTDQDYVFHWVRDASIAALEMPYWPIVPKQALNDYVIFSRATQLSGASIGFACYRVDATPRDGKDPMELKWSEQSDGPGLRIASLLNSWSYLDENVKTIAREVVLADLSYLLANYRLPTRNLWEESIGYSFFVRSVHLSAFIELSSFSDPSISQALDRPRLQAAITELQHDLVQHWDQGAGRYQAILSPSDPRGAGLDVGTIMAAVYGAAAIKDSRMMATFHQMKTFCAGEYPINQVDATLGIGPLIGRYPGDIYDGDWAEPNIGQPWALCTCNCAEYLFALAEMVRESNAVPIDELNTEFFRSMNIGAKTSPSDAITNLMAAGDRLLDAILRHADHLHLSEQFDRYSGYEKSVRDLTWSYASFASAVRARQRAFGLQTAPAQLAPNAASEQEHAIPAA
jgi:glucoamylase